MSASESSRPPSGPRRPRATPPRPRPVSGSRYRRDWFYPFDVAPRRARVAPQRPCGFVPPDRVPAARRIPFERGRACAVHLPWRDRAWPPRCAHSPRSAAPVPGTARRRVRPALALLHLVVEIGQQTLHGARDLSADVHEHHGIQGAIGGDGLRDVAALHHLAYVLLFGRWSAFLLPEEKSRHEDSYDQDGQHRLVPKEAV